MHTDSYRGFSLLEVLITLVILSFGMLGGLSLQLATMHAAQTAHFDTVALQLAAGVAEQTARAGASPPWQSVDTGTAGVAASVSCYGVAATCSPEQLADFSQHEWALQLAVQLPQARLQICHDGSPWQTAPMTLRWGCSGNRTDATWVRIGWSERRYGADPTPQPRLALLGGRLQP